MGGGGGGVGKRIFFSRFALASLSALARKIRSSEKNKTSLDRLACLLAIVPSVTKSRSDFVTVLNAWSATLESWSAGPRKYWNQGSRITGRVSARIILSKCHYFQK